MIVQYVQMCITVYYVQGNYWEYSWLSILHSFPIQRYKHMYTTLIVQDFDV
jgi:hypothetical protein